LDVSAKSLNDHITTDYELMRRVAGRDEAALAELYDRHGRLVMSVAQSVVGDRATAEEVTLDIFSCASGRTRQPTTRRWPACPPG
jgi:DNA-directed RNA polymerase specialized sigma24 family protein